MGTHFPAARARSARNFKGKDLIGDQYEKLLASFLTEGQMEEWPEGAALFAAAQRPGGLAGNRTRPAVLAGRRPSRAPQAAG